MKPGVTMRDKDGITGRVVVVAAVALLALIPISFYVEIIWFKVDVASGAPAPYPLAMLLCLSAAMMLPLLRRVGLTRRELLAIYCLVTVGGGVVSGGLLPFALSRNIAYYYAARANPHWEQLFLKSIPTWYAPSDLGTVDEYFQGGGSVPWGKWVLPAGAEVLYITLLFAALASIMVLLREQWISHERLAFPLAQVPLEITREGYRDTSAGGLSPSLALWIGLTASLLVSLANSLSERWPWIPAVPLGPIPIVRWQKVGILAGIGDIELFLWPSLIALAYLVPRELSFSVWFFWIVRLALHVIAVANGATPQPASEWWGPEFPAPYFQGAGGGFTLLALVLWGARGHLKRVALAALGHRDSADDNSSRAYRAALITLVASLAGLVCYLQFANCRLLFALALVGGIVAVRLVQTRLRAEAGIGFINFPLELQDLAVYSFGSTSFRTAELVALTSRQWSFFGAGGFAYLPSAVIESLKIADSGRVNWRRLMLAAAALTALVLIGGSVLWLFLVNRIGFMSMRAAPQYSSFSWQTMNAGGRAANWLLNPSAYEVSPGAMMALGAGAAVTLALGALRLRYWWWPLHPVGYIVANTWVAKWSYMPYFVGWVCKSLVIRYGGLRLYRATVPLAIGAIIGDTLNTAIWGAVAVISGGRI